jgi:hypothetical protein
MPEEPKGDDRLWLVLCTSTGVTVDVTLNKYSSQLPGWLVLGLWGIPAFLFIVWLWHVEKTHGWVKKRFLEHRVSYVVMFLIFVPFVWQATATMISKLRFSEPVAKRDVIPAQNSQQPKTPSSAPQTFSVGQNPPTYAPSEQSKKRGNPKKYPSLEIPKPRPVQTVLASPQSPAQPTYGSQTCIGSACAQGPGSQATLNEFGAPKLVMTNDQRDAIRDAMRPFAGMVVEIMCNNATEDTMEYANQLSKALNDAGMKAGPPTSGILFSAQGHAIPSGVMLTVGDDAIPAATALAQTMARAGLISKSIPADHATQKARFEITISPNR